MKRIGLSAIGAYVPEHKLTNADLERMIDTTDEWIVSRTGIKERRIASEETFTSDMAEKAARVCLSKSNFKPDLLISSTSTPERNCPYQASIVANRLNLKDLAAFDLNAACSGFVYGIAAAFSLIQTNGFEHAMITASEKMSSLTDYSDRATCILFGDGASALMISAEDYEHEILVTELGIDASGSGMVTMGGKGDEYYFRQDGRKVFRFAVTKVAEIIDKLKKKAGIRKKDKFYVIPHQANIRIIETVSKNKNISLDHFIINIDKYGNTSSASIGLALEEAWRKDTFKKGDYLLLVGFGGGLSWAGAAIRW